MCRKTEPGTASSVVQVSSDRTRVTEWRFRKKGENTGWHRHDFDYVVVPLHDGRLELREAGGAIRFADLTAGAAYFRKSGVEHDVVSANDFEFAFVEIEFL